MIKEFEIQINGHWGTFRGNEEQAKRAAVRFRDRLVDQEKLDHTARYAVRIQSDDSVHWATLAPSDPAAVRSRRRAQQLARRNLALALVARQQVRAEAALYRMTLRRLKA